MQLSQGGGTHLCRKTSQGNVPGISFEPIPNIPIYKLVFGLFNWEKEEVLMPQGEMAENKDQFSLWDLLFITEQAKRSMDAKMWAKRL